MFESIDEKKRSIIFLVLGFIFSTFSMGRFNIAIFIFLWPWMNLYFIHHHEKKCTACVFILISCLVSNMIKWIGNTGINVGLDFISGMYWGIVPYLPFLIEKLIIDKVERWRQVLLFPLLVSSFEFLFSYMPISNQSVYGNALVYNLILTQTCAAFGIYFVSFMLALFSSILEYTIEIYEKTKKFSKIILIYLLCAFVFILYGSIRLLVPIDRENIKVVSALGVSQPLYDKGIDTICDLNIYYDYIEKVLVKANGIDAQLVVFAEEAFSLHEDNFSIFLETSSQKFANHSIYGVLTYDIERNDGSYSNALSIIGDQGEILYNYTKHRVIPLVEYGYKRGTSDPQVIDTKIGKITTVICYDLNYPPYINYIGLKHPDILIAPSWDYEGVYKFQSENARLRAIENGFNLLKATADGATVCSDYYGERHSYSIAWIGEDFLVVNEVPRYGVETLYSYIGVGFNFLYIIGVFLVVFIKRKKIELDVEEEVKDMRLTGDETELENQEDDKNENN